MYDIHVKQFQFEKNIYTLQNGTLSMVYGHASTENILYLFNSIQFS